MSSGHVQLTREISYHPAIKGPLDSFRLIITALVWLQHSPRDAQNFYALVGDSIGLPCSTGEFKGQTLNVHTKNLLETIIEGGENAKSPMLNEALLSFYRIFTIAIKDIVWANPDFQPILARPELEFMRHIRNASAHNGRFHFGTGRKRDDTLKHLPVSWRDKIINESVEGVELFKEFFMPGDIFLLLEDISALAQNEDTPGFVTIESDPTNL